MNLKILHIILVLLILTIYHRPIAFSSNLTSKNKKKTQEVNFEEMTIQGQVKNPQGAYLVQKNGIKFLPLYEVKKNMDHKIRDSAEWLR